MSHVSVTAWRWRTVDESAHVWPRAGSLLLLAMATSEKSRKLVGSSYQQEIEGMQRCLARRQRDAVAIGDGGSVRMRRNGHELHEDVAAARGEKRK